MDNDPSTPAPSASSASVSLPKSAPLSTPVGKIEESKAASPTVPVEPTAAKSYDSGDRNAIFKTLVTDDSDIAGLVAYSIYKQNKLDWLTAFETAKGRTPNEIELASYIIGEGTPRRLATYRHLAEATLAGNGPDIDGSPRSARSSLRGGFGDKGTITAGLVTVYVLIGLLFLLGFWLAAHYTMGPR